MHADVWALKWLQAYYIFSIGNIKPLLSAEYPRCGPLGACRAWHMWGLLTPAADMMAKT